MSVFQVFEIKKYFSNPWGAVYGTESGQTENFYSLEYQKYLILYNLKLSFKKVSAFFEKSFI